ncbi:hypothetical protein BGZ89_005711 [Linnemannia elongata]|nr:hypothetical protein BGZ89_005711 [Linnemannia elongata]
MKILSAVIYTVAAISGVAATWMEDGPLTVGRYGIRERDLIFEMKELFSEFHAGLGPGPKQPWMNKVPNQKFLERYDSTRPGYTAWRVSPNLQQQPVGTPDRPLVKESDADIVALKARYGSDLTVKSQGGGARSRVVSYTWKVSASMTTKATGDYRGIPVQHIPQYTGNNGRIVPGSYTNIQGTVLKIGGPAEGEAPSPEDSPVQNLDYKQAIDSIGGLLGGDAYETVNDGAGNPLMSRLVLDGGRKVTISKMLSRYVTGLPAGARRDSLMGKIQRVQDGVRTVAVMRYNSLREFNSPALFRPLGSVGLVTPLDNLPILGPTEGTISVSSLEDVVSHVSMLVSWQSVGVPIWQEPAGTHAGETSPFTCPAGGTTKRNLAKRADACVPKIVVTGKDSLGAKDKGAVARRARQADILRRIRELTKDVKIFPNDNGGTPPEDPFTGDIPPREMHADAEDADGAWELVTNAFETIIDTQPELLDKSMVASVIRAFKEDYRFNIATIKARPDTRLLMGLFRNQMISAESRKNSIDNLAKKYLATFGTSYRAEKSADDQPNSALDTLNENGVGEDVETTFDGSNYGSAQDVGSVAEASVMDDLAEVTGAMQPVAKQPDVEGGEEGGIDMSRAVPGTNEYAQVYRVMATVTRDLIKNPATPKWKLLRLRATLARNVKSLEMRIKVLETKQKDGDTITQKEVDEYNAIHDFHEVTSTTLEERDIDSMTTTPEDKAKIDTAPEYGEDPMKVLPPPARLAVKPQVGKPSWTRAGIGKIPLSNRKTVGKVGSKQGTPRGGTI